MVVSDSGHGAGEAADGTAVAAGFLGYWREYNAAFDRARAGIAQEPLARLFRWLEELRARRGQLFVLGNGGSAASASHWACDFGKGVNVSGSSLPRFRVLSPADHLPWHTALSNDVSYADALAEQLANWVRIGDLIVALSVSGDSENLVRAFGAGRARGARLVAVVGGAGGRLRSLADLAIVIPSRDYGVVEDLHMTINHAITQFLRRQALGEALPAAAADGNTGR